MSIGLDVIPFYVDILEPHYDPGQGLWRNVFSSQPMNQTAPEVAYYVLRSLCTVMGGQKPNETMTVEFSEKGKNFDNYNFDLPDGVLLAAVWLPGKSRDNHSGVKTDITIKNVSAKKVVGIELLNGFEQELKFKQVGGDVLLPALRVRDTPLLVRLETK